MRFAHRLTRSLGCAAIALLWVVATPPALPANAKAAAANAAYTDWNLADLYPSLKDWQDSYARTQAGTDALGAYQGTLGNSADALLKALLAVSDLNREAARLYVYTSLASDQDVRVSANLERNQQSRSLLTRVAEKSSWMAPEILQVGEAKVRAFVAQNATLKHRFGHFLDNTLRSAPHTLGLEAERVLAGAGDVLAQPDTVHSQLADSELPVPTVTLSDGTQVRLTQAAYSKYRQSPVRADRKLVFDGYWGAWKKFEGTTGSLLVTQVMGRPFHGPVPQLPHGLGGVSVSGCHARCRLQDADCRGQRRAADAPSVLAAAQAAARRDTMTCATTTATRRCSSSLAHLSSASLNPSASRSKR